MKKNLFMILSVFAFICIHISPSLSMDGRKNNLPDTFWNSLPGNFMTLGGNLENDLRKHEQEYEDFTMLPIHNGKRRSDVGFIDGSFWADSAVTVTPCTAPSVIPTLYSSREFPESIRRAVANNEEEFIWLLENSNSFCDFLNKTKKESGNKENIEKFILFMKNNNSVRNEIILSIRENSYSTNYWNYISIYRGYK